MSHYFAKWAPVAALLSVAGCAGAAAADDTVAAHVAALTSGAPAAGAPADVAIHAIAAAYRVRVEQQLPDALYARIQTALRRQVEGLAVSLLQAPGVRFRRVPGSDDVRVTVASDAARVDLVWTSDDWASTHALPLSATPGGFVGTLPSLPREGRLTYAVHLFAADGGDLWLNNPREAADRHAWRLDHTLTIGATDAHPLPPSRPALALLVRALADPTSLGGTTVVADELSLVVEQLTWEGSSGIDDPDALDPALDELAAMRAEGVAFDDYDAMVGFIRALRFRRVADPDADFGRDGAGRLTLAARAPWQRVYWSTDGWATPHVTRCDAGADGRAVCALGLVPAGALLSWSSVVPGSDGSSEVAHRAPDGGNFFVKAPR